MTVEIIENIVEVPETVNLTLDGHKVAVTGTNGTVTRDFGHTKLNLSYQDNSFRIWVENPRKKQASLVNTLASHVRNMMKGVTEGFTYKLKIVFIHFPMTINVQKNKVVINNFVGERQARIAKIYGDVQVKVEGDDVIVTGNDIENVAQTAANIEQSTKIRNKDLRKFLDGIYVYYKE
ncbi:50S ribosomal protein L6 [Candidatus Bathyarchaeota archaeon]|nr:MAG: 50S ribosomal protein L6 [Candidatus Bathyarchaeota archaeon]